MKNTQHNGGSVSIQDRRGEFTTDMFTKNLAHVRTSCESDLATNILVVM